MDGLCVFLGIAAFALSAHAEVTAINGDVKVNTQQAHHASLSM
jgi:hypothetical protein